MSFLVGGASITFEFVIIAERLRVAEVSQTPRNRRVLLNINAQVEKIFVLTRYRFAVETPCFTGENALKYISDPRVRVFCRLRRLSERSRGGRNGRTMGLTSEIIFDSPSSISMHYVVL
jgi:hypothetical protein